MYGGDSRIINTTNGDWGLVPAGKQFSRDRKTRYPGPGRQDLQSGFEPGLIYMLV